MFLLQVFTTPSRASLIAKWIIYISSGLTLVAGVIYISWFLWVIRRDGARHKQGRCMHCGYDLRYSKDRCPECGEPFQSR